LCTSITTVIYSNDLLTYNVEYFQTLSEQKWQTFANSLRSMPKLRSIVHEDAWQFNSLACSSRLMFGRVTSTIAFRSLFSSNRLSKRT